MCEFDVKASTGVRSPEPKCCQKTTVQQLIGVGMSTHDDDVARRKQTYTPSEQCRNDARAFQL